VLPPCIPGRRIRRRRMAMADVVACMVQATEPFFRACRPAGSEERSAAVERGWVFGPRSLSIFRACRSSRQGALLQPGGVSLQGHAKHILRSAGCGPPKGTIRYPPSLLLRRASAAGSRPLQRRGRLNFTPLDAKCIRHNPATGPSSCGYCLTTLSRTRVRAAK